jgi:ornithine cyclodeaminase
VNAVGSASPIAREVDTAAVRKSRLFVDCRESALNEAGDFIIPKREGAVTDDDILGEIGELLIGKMQGRIDEHDITLFKSLGIAVQDAVVAEHLYRRATDTGTGTEVELGGMRLTSDE